MRFGLKDVNELPSMEEFEKLVAESFQSELIPAETAADELAKSTKERAAESSRESLSESSESLSETKKAG
jgi:segregation and condensation protein B